MPRLLRRDHRGKSINVSYDVQRCIHAEECTRGLPRVFNRGRMPWIDPDGADPKAIADTVTRCPSGALRYERKDAGLPEGVPDTNTIDLVPNGPLYVRGELRIQSVGGQVRHHDVRLALCRCGESLNKPFCDNSHLKSGFRTGPAKPGQQQDLPRGEKLQITPIRNGPYSLLGPVEIRDPSRGTVYKGRMVRLCRCGHSEEKPFCDNSHDLVGFQARDW